MPLTPRRSLPAIVSRWRQCAPGSLADDPRWCVLPDRQIEGRPMQPVAIAESPFDRWEQCRRWMQGRDAGLSLIGALPCDPRFSLFLVHQGSVSRDVLVKAAAPHLANDPSLLQFLARESSILTQLRHPGIPTVIDAGTGFLIHSGIRGATLEEQLPQGAPCLDPEPAVAVLEQVVEVLASAHEQRFLHRDLHAGCIRIDETGMAWVVDWGCAVQLDGGWDAWQRMRSVDPLLLCVGTPVSLAPEVARMDEGLVGTPSDLFQLGGILYRILAGQPPFAADTVGQAIDRASANRWAPVHSLNPAAPHQLVAAAQQAMEGNPARRGDLGSFAEALAAWRRSVHGGSAPEQLMAEAVVLLHRIRARREPVSRLADVIEACDRTVQQVPTHPLARQILASAQALQRLTAGADAGSGRWERFTRLLHPTPKP